MAKKPPEIGQKQVIVMGDFSGGQNDAVHPALLNDNECSVLESASLDEKGTLIPDKGRVERYAANFDTNPVAGIGAYYKSDGTSRLLIAAGTSLYSDKPHIVTTYDAQADWETGRLGAIDTTTTAGDISVKTQAVPTFTRDSVAYLSDGTQVASGVPRYETGKFGSSVMVEEGTTNLLTANQSSVETDTTGFGALGSTISRDTTIAWHGSASLKVITNNTVGSEGFHVRYTTSNQGTYIGQVRLQGTGRVWSAVRINYSDSTYDQSTFLYTDLTSAWQHVVTNAVTSDSTKTVSSVDFYVRTDGQQAITFYADGLQLEANPYATSWTLGGSTRSPETLSLPTAGVLNPQEGTVEFWVYVTEATKALNTYHYLFDCDAGTNVKRITLTHERPGNRWFALITNDSGSSNDILVDDTLSTGWHFFVVRWSASEFALFIDGIKAGYVNNPLLPSGFGSTLYIGSRGSSEHGNALYDDLRISSRARTDTEISDAYTSNAPLPVDADTTYKLALDSNLDVDQPTYGNWYSPTIDASSATDKASGHAALTQTTPGVSTIETASRSSPDQAAWTDWVSALADGTLQHVADNYVQIRLRLHKDGTNNPSVQKMVVSFDGQPATTLLASDFTAGGDYFFDTLLDYEVVVNGIDVPRKFDGTTLTAMAGTPPRGEYVVAHKNRLWMLVGSRLYFSDLLNIESWPALNFIDISPNDGDEGTGLLATADYLVITKNRSIWLLVGDSIDTFSVRRLSANIGCIAPRSLTMVNNMLCFVADDGIYFSDFAQTVLASERLRKTWQGLNLRRLNQAASSFHRYKLRVAVPSANSMINDMVLVYDTIRQSWYIRRNWNISCWTSFVESGQQAVLFGHSDKGQVSEIDRGYTDQGAGIPFAFESKHHNMGIPQHVKRFRDMYAVVVPGPSDAVLNFKFTIDDGPLSSPIAVTVPGATNSGERTLRIIPSQVGVVQGHSIGIRIEQNTPGSPIGIHSLALYYYIKGARASL